MNTESFLFSGCYTRRGGRGICATLFSASTGGISTPQLVAESQNPSFLVIDSSKRILFAVSETTTFRQQCGGAVSSFSVDQRTGKLACLSTISSSGTLPCHIALDQTNCIAIVSNYGSGSIATFGVGADGCLSLPTWAQEFTGSSVHTARQTSPHPHGAFIHPSNRFAVVPDLGTDRLYFYRLDLGAAILRESVLPSLSLQPGTGPRHLAFHPDGHSGYLIGELNSSVAVLDCDVATGRIVVRSCQSTLMRPWYGINQPAGIVVHDSGRFLYCSNRGADTIVQFEIDAGGGLRPCEQIDSGGKTPRHLVIDPTGRFLLVANQDSDTIAVFAISGEDGVLTDTGIRAHIKEPSCLVFAPRGPA